MTSIRDSWRSFAILSSFAIIPTTQLSVNAEEESAMRRIDLEGGDVALDLLL